MKILLITILLSITQLSFAEYAYVNCSTAGRGSHFIGFVKLDNLELHTNGAGFNISGNVLGSASINLGYSSNAEYVKRKFDTQCNPDHIKVYNKVDSVVRNFRCVGGEYRIYPDRNVFNNSKTCHFIDLDFEENELPNRRTKGEAVEEFLWRISTF